MHFNRTDNMRKLQNFPIATGVGGAWGMIKQLVFSEVTHFCVTSEHVH